jgi:histidinol-phosphate phosphatase family protein
MAGQLVILAGGKGTRLAERLHGLPKPLVDVAGVPLLERQILHAKGCGFDSVVLLVNHRAEIIEDFCRARADFGLNVCLIDDGEPKGTAGAVLAALPVLQDDFLVMYGDTLLNIDLGRFQAFHQARPDAAACLLVHPNDHPQDSDLVEVDASGVITGIHPYPHPAGADLANLVNAALYWVRKDALLPWVEAHTPLDFAKDLFPLMIEAGQKLYGYATPEYIKDIGTPKRLDRAVADLASGRMSRSNLRSPQAAVFLDRDGVINKECGFLRSKEQFELLPGAAESIRRFNQAGLLVVVVTNQPVIARGECSEAELTDIHRRMETLLGAKGAYVDRIYFCPHHPDAGFAGERPELKGPCACRKPEIGMLLAGQKELNIDFAQSWMVGDRTGDILAAKRAGVRSILVETGAAGLDGKHEVSPDYRAKDIGQACEIILGARS